MKHSSTKNRTKGKQSEPSEVWDFDFTDWGTDFFKNWGAGFDIETPNIIFDVPDFESPVFDFATGYNL